ncbi:MAG: hypothetical protein AAF235_06510, partial [Planctomycetota bacterium]
MNTSSIEAAQRAGWRWDHSYAALPEELLSPCEPAGALRPSRIVFNAALATSLGLDAEALSGSGGARVLSGDVLPEGAKPIAQAYAGHQF